MFGKKADASLIHGSVAPGFEGVEAQFRENFERRGELGTACAIYCQGKKVVDLWGGYRDSKTRAPWEEDTLVLVFSATKGLASMTLAVANSRGLLDYDERVAAYWPEFAAEGKGETTVRQLLSHQAGLCVPDEPVDPTMLANPDLLARMLARQQPLWEPGTKHAYHAFSLGWYEGELIRRVDPHHRTLGRFFQDEIAKPLGLEFYIGLPADIPGSRIATLKMFGVLDFFFLKSRTSEMSLPFLKSMADKQSLAARAFAHSKRSDLSDRAFLALENPAYTGVGQVRSIARAYSAFAIGGSELGITSRTLEALTGPPVLPTLGTYDEMLRVEVIYSLGFMRPSKGVDFGVSGKAFGTAGAGGSFGFADPDAGVGYAYAPNRMGLYLFDDPREKALRDAFYEGLKKLPKDEWRRAS
ncbi:MAG TPA: serine hydrolase domain-containing protein [Terriglobia bacterium]|nr:serine hydrolase domain-containing protein [Terriglobia bacterium]